MMNDLGKLITPYAMRIANLFGRGTINLVDSSKKTQTVQINLFAGEVKDDVEHFEPYGYTSHPKVGAEHLTGFLGGNRSHGVVIVVADRRYRLKGLAEGEVAIYDDQGQKVHLTRAGIVIDGAGKPINIQNTPHLTATTAKMTITGDLEVLGKADVTGNISSLATIAAAINVTASSGALSMTNMKTIYNGHTHSDPQGGSVSATTSTM
jgi:phage baseplate assembly protein V